MWSASRKSFDRTVASLEIAARASMAVGVISPFSVDEMLETLGWDSTGGTDLILADSGSGEVAVVGENGARRVESTPSQDLCAVAVLKTLWLLGIDARDVVFLIDGLTGVTELLTLLVSEISDLTVVVVNLRRASIPPGVVFLTGGSARLRQLLADQLRRRRRRALPEANVRPGWSLSVEGFNAKHERVQESLMTLANGHVGTSGVSLARNPSQRPWVVSAGIYDGEGPETHLLTGPKVFELTDIAGGRPVRRVLDLHSGVLHEWTTLTDGQTLESVRFVSLADTATSVLRVLCPHRLKVGLPLTPPADDSVHDEGRTGAATWMRVAASTGGIAAAASQIRTNGGALDRLASYESDPDTLPEPSRAVNVLQRAETAGFDRLLADHRGSWARRWENADVVVEGDDELQRAIRFALFHLMASVADTGEAAVGARGLTGTGYRGHVFWDADVFVLPFLAATHPPAARAMLEYRVRRLMPAMEAARGLGRVGARFPWESARTGRDVTPKSARDRSGKIVPIRTGELEEHIVADVSWAACCYVNWSGDEEIRPWPMPSDPGRDGPVLGITDLCRAG